MIKQFIWNWKKTCNKTLKYFHPKKKPITTTKERSFRNERKISWSRFNGMKTCRIYFVYFHGRRRRSRHLFPFRSLLIIEPRQRSLFSIWCVFSIIFLHYFSISSLELAFFLFWRRTFFSIKWFGLVWNGNWIWHGKFFFLYPLQFNIQRVNNTLN